VAVDQKLCQCCTLPAGLLAARDCGLEGISGVELKSDASDETPAAVAGDVIALVAVPALADSHGFGGDGIVNERLIKKRVENLKRGGLVGKNGSNNHCQQKSLKITWSDWASLSGNVIHQSELTYFWVGSRIGKFHSQLLTFSVHLRKVLYEVAYLPCITSNVLTSKNGSFASQNHVH
jgi:hypothetical protein